MRMTSRQCWTRKASPCVPGNICCGPLMEHLDLTATCRASFAMYNTHEEVDALIDGLELCHDLFA